MSYEFVSKSRCWRREDLRETAEGHNGSISVACGSGCKNRMASTLFGWYCTVVSKGASVLWKAVVSLDANGSTGHLEPKGERLKNGADPEGSIPHEGDGAVLERREPGHRL